MLRSNHLCVWVDYAYFTGVKSWYPVWYICTGGGRLRGGVVSRQSLWCGSIYRLLGMAFIPMFLGSISMGGLSSRLICVRTWCIGCLCGEKSRVCTCMLDNSEVEVTWTYYLYQGMICTYMYGIFQWSPGCPGASSCVICFLVLGCVRLISYCESLCGMYEWCTGVCYSMVICLCSVWC